MDMQHALAYVQYSYQYSYQWQSKTSVPGNAWVVASQTLLHTCAWDKLHNLQCCQAPAIKHACLPPDTAATCQRTVTQF
jgi:hypothetical protein